MNPYATLGRAATGDLDALRSLALEAFALTASEGNLTALDEAIVFARLAFAHSQDAEDAGRLVQAMALAATVAESEDRREALQAECLATVAVAIDHADGETSDQLEAALDALVREAPAAIVAEAQGLRKLIKGQE